MPASSALKGGAKLTDTHIAANTEYKTTYNHIEKINFYNFIAIGYYSISYPDGTKKNMFKNGQGTPFDWLNEININEYISIYDLEQKLNIVFICIDKGSFYSPFYEFFCKIGNDQLLYIMGSPSDDKKESYFFGGWSFHVQGIPD
jgi:hypothetical protein